jgi:hypothetical protein
LSVEIPNRLMNQAAPKIKEVLMEEFNRMKPPGMDESILQEYIDDFLKKALPKLVIKLSAR